MTMKCRHCGETKELERFCKGTTITGRTQPCYSCWHRIRSERDPDYIKKCLIRGRERYARKREELCAIKRALPKKKQPFTYKLKARAALKHAVRKGMIVKPDCCGDCGERLPKAKLQGHHEDYRKPYAVVWVCSACHGKRHRINLGGE